MGVKGLWQLLLPTGRRISIETLQGKKLAIDASIWLVQFIKANRDPETGKVRANAHIVGFLRRICKLLFHGIRPVFVFDGATPAIKLMEIRRRRERRDKMQSFKSDDDEGVKRLARRLLIANLKKQKELEKAAQSKSRTLNDTANNGASNAFAVGFHLPSNENGIVDSATPSSSGNVSKDRTNHNIQSLNEPNDEVLVLSDSEDYLKHSVETHQPMQMNDWNNSFEERSSQSSDASVEIPVNEEDIDLEALATVPSKMRVGIIEKARIQQRLKSRKEFMSVAANPVNYSQCQLRNFLKSTRLNQKVTKLASIVKGDDGLEGERIASDASKRFVFTKETQPSVESDSDDFEPSPKRAKGDFSPEKDTKRLRKNKSAINTYDSDDSDDVFIITQKFSKPNKFASQFLEEDDDDEMDNTNENYQGSKSKIAELNKNTIRNSDTEFIDSESTAENRNELFIPNEQTKRKSPIQQEGGGFLPNDTDDTKKVLHGQSSEHIYNNIDSSSDEEVEQLFENKTTCNSASTSIKRCNGEIILNKNHPIEPAKSEEDIDWEDCEVDEDNFIHDIDDRPEFIDSEPLVPRIMIKPLEAEERKNNLPPEQEKNTSKNHLDTKKNKMFKVYENRHVEAEQLGEDVEWEDCEVDEDNFIHDIDASEPQNQHTAIKPTEGEERKNNLSPEREESFMCAEDRNRNNQWWKTDESMQKSEEEEEHDETKSFYIADEINVTRIPTSEKLNAEAIKRAQATAANLTDWAGRAVQRAIAAHIEDSNIQSSQEEDGSISNDSDSSEPVCVQTVPRSPKIVDPKIDTSLEGLQKEDLLLREEYNRIERDIDTVTDEMIHETMELLTLFGIPYLRAPAEAESQCVELEKLGLVDGVVTEDSDALVFGCKSLYKNIFDDKKYVEAYLSSDAEKIGIGFNEKIALAMLLGGDYTQGVTGVGIVNGMEIIKSFGPWDGDTSKISERLQEFRKWMNGYDFAETDSVDNDQIHEFQKKHRSARSRWILPPDFPAANVLQAYSRPVVDSSNDRFSWEKPDIDQLRSFLSRKLGWDSNETDKAVLPVLSRTRQTRLDGYFMRIEDEIKFADVKSKRLREVWKMDSQDGGNTSSINNVE